MPIPALGRFAGAALLGSHRLRAATSRLQTLTSTSTNRCPASRLVSGAESAHRGAAARSARGAHTHEDEGSNPSPAIHQRATLGAWTSPLDTSEPSPFSRSSTRAGAVPPFRPGRRPATSASANLSESRSPVPPCATPGITPRAAPTPPSSRSSRPASAQRSPPSAGLAALSAALATPVATTEPWYLMTRWAWCVYGDPRPLLVTRWRWYARWCTIFDAMTYVCPWQR
jgi:hypothetical protein